jgi:hypothetical protein
MVVAQRKERQPNAMRRDATQSNGMQGNATQRNATQRNATQRNAKQRNETKRLPKNEINIVPSENLNSSRSHRFQKVLRCAAQLSLEVIATETQKAKELLRRKLPHVFLRAIFAEL